MYWFSLSGFYYSIDDIGMVVIIVMEEE